MQTDLQWEGSLEEDCGRTDCDNRESHASIILLESTNMGIMPTEKGCKIGKQITKTPEIRHANTRK